MVDRLGLGMLALGAAGIAWLASAQPSSPAPARSLSTRPPSPHGPREGNPRSKVGRIGASRRHARDRSTSGPALALPACEIGAMGGEQLHEPMRGPFASLAAECTHCAIDAETMTGRGPIAELTVMHLGQGQPDLGADHQIDLALRVGEHWYFRSLGQIGPICGGLGSPTWLDATADAPQLCSLGDATFVTVVVHETADQGDSHRSWNKLVTCGVVDETGTPSCTERALP